MAPFPPCECICSGLYQRKWPELLGVAGLDACLAIEKSNPNVRAFIRLISESPEKDFCCNRVLVYVENHHGIVVKVPKVG